MSILGWSHIVRIENDIIANREDIIAVGKYIRNCIPTRLRGLNDILPTEIDVESMSVSPLKNI